MKSSFESSRRSFEGLDYDLHERLPFSIVEISHSQSVVFDVDICYRMDQVQQRVLAEFEANGGREIL